MQAIAAGVVVVIMIFGGTHEQTAYEPTSGTTPALPETPTSVSSDVLPTKSPPPPATAQHAPAPRPVYKTSASDLSIMYGTNEVAADRKIGNAVVEVTGTIAAIDNDFMGNPVVRFATGDQYSTANMDLKKANAATAATLSVGNTATVRCESMQRILDAPSGHDCDLVGR